MQVPRKIPTVLKEPIDHPHKVNLKKKKATFPLHISRHIGSVEIKQNHMLLKVEKPLEIIKFHLQHPNPSSPSQLIYL